MRRGVSALVILGVVLGFLGAVLSPGAQGARERVKYPQGYRKWTHVKSMVIQKGHPLFQSFGGIHHIYANEAALKAMRSNRPFPNGAVFVFDLLEAKAERNAIVEGPRKVVGVMERHPKRFAETGGWGFEAFKGDTEERGVRNANKECFACHEKQTGHVFSQFHK